MSALDYIKGALWPNNDLSQLSAPKRSTSWLNQIAFARKKRALELQKIIESIAPEPKSNKDYYTHKPYMAAYRDKPYITDYYREDYIMDEVAKLEAKENMPYIDAEYEEPELANEAKAPLLASMQRRSAVTLSKDQAKVLQKELSAKEEEAKKAEEKAKKYRDDLQKRIAELGKMAGKYAIHSNETAYCAYQLLKDLRTHILVLSESPERDLLIAKYTVLEQALTNYDKVGTYAFLTFKKPYTRMFAGSLDRLLCIASTFAYVMFVEPFHRLFCIPDTKKEVQVNDDLTGTRLEYTYKVNGLALFFAIIYPPKLIEYFIEAVNGFLDHFGSQGGAMKWENYDREHRHLLLESTNGLLARKIAVFIIRLILVAPLQSIINLLVHPWDTLLGKLLQHLLSKDINRKGKALLIAIHAVKLVLLALSILFSAGVLSGPLAAAFSHLTDWVANHFIAPILQHIAEPIAGLISAQAVTATATVIPALAAFVVVNTITQQTIDTARDATLTAEFAEGEERRVVTPVPDEQYFTESPRSTKISDEVNEADQKKRKDKLTRIGKLDTITEEKESKKPLLEEDDAADPDVPFHRNPLYEPLQGAPVNPLRAQQDIYTQLYGSSSSAAMAQPNPSNETAATITATPSATRSAGNDEKTQPLTEVLSSSSVLAKVTASSMTTATPPRQPPKASRLPTVQPQTIVKFNFSESGREPITVAKIENALKRVAGLSLDKLVTYCNENKLANIGGSDVIFDTSLPEDKKRKFAAYALWQEFNSRSDYTQDLINNEAKAPNINQFVLWYCDMHKLINSNTHATVEQKQAQASMRLA